MERPPNEDEIKRALTNTKNYKVPGLDNIPPELLKEAINLTAVCLKEFGNRKKSLRSRKKAFYLNYQRKKIFLTVHIGEELHFFL
jgi:hypothetical protein